MVAPTKVKLKLTQRIREDCVYLVHGFGVRSKDLGRAFGKGVGDEQLMTRLTKDPAMGGVGCRNNFVKIVREG